MSKAHQYIIKAAALRAQADKLEKVAALVGRDADSGSGSMSTAAKIGIGAGALGLGGGTLLGQRFQNLQRANDLKNLKNAMTAGAVTLGGLHGLNALNASDSVFGAGASALAGGIKGGILGHSLLTMWNNAKDYLDLKNLGLL